MWVMTGFGAATRVSNLHWGVAAMVISCGAVGLSAVQGCVLSGANRVVAVDPNPARRQVAQAIGATGACTPDAAVDIARSPADGCGADVVIEAVGRPAAFRLAVEAVRPGGQVVWVGKVGMNEEVAFRWGALMQEKRITRSSDGRAKPARDFPLLAQAYLDGRLKLDEMISERIYLAQINDGFAAPKRGETMRSVVVFNSQGSA
jgi:S-(hydroxymethyl)glutathione dehydrogenase / alcohol dehydrogenase